MRPPIIVFGSHRSGTTMIVEMLEALGMFAGKRQDAYGEALFFLRFNQWLMHRSGAGWDHPEPMLELFTSKHATDAREVAQACAEARIHSPHTLSYLGWPRFLRERRLDRLTFSWGWKDPRNTFTLPLWLECFPDAKLVHVMRHGVDVADSLTRRHRAGVAGGRDSFRARRGRYLLTPYRARFFDTVTCSSLAGSFGVWEQYMSEARRQVGLAGSQAIEVRFEDLLADPLGTLGTLAKFCGIDASSGRLHTAANHAREDRAYAFRSRPDLQEFAEDVADRLAAYQYCATADG
jgi:LPS sulfotransferase NodH